MPHDVFISYSQGDKTAADAACAVLEGKGIRCWIAPRDVPPGKPWAESILKAMETAQVMVLVFSSNANRSDQVSREVERAVGKGIPIIPVRLENVLPAKSLEYFLGTTHWLDAFPPPIENYFNRLAEAVRGHLDSGTGEIRVAAVPPVSPRGRRQWIAAGCAMLLAAVAAAAFFLWPQPVPGQFAIAPISLPQKFADATGMTGQVVAEHLLDRLNALETKSDTYAMRRKDSFTVGGKSTAPFAGLFETRTEIAGDIVQSGEGWRLSLRAEGRDGVMVPVGKDTDAAIDDGAHKLFATIEPYRYAIVLGEEHKPGGEIDFLKIAQSPENPDHLWAASKLSENEFAHGDFAAACNAAEDANNLDPKFIPAMLDLANCRYAMGDLGSAQTLMEEGARRLAGKLPPDIEPASIVDYRPQLKSRLLESEGAWSEAVAARIPVRGSNVNWLSKKMPPWDASDDARAHDIPAALKRMRDAGMDMANGGVEDGKALIQFQTVGFAPANFFVAAATEDWATAAKDLETADKISRASGNVNDVRRRWLWPWLAYAWAREGRMKEADALIAMAPEDSYVTLEMRGRIAAARGDGERAARWFDRAVTAAPALAFAYTDWGAALLAHGDAKGAIAKFEAAHGKAPEFADPVEMWGEALMAENRSDLALAEFGEAEPLAPQWGRLHLKFAEAYFFAAQLADARRELAAARSLALSAADTRELAAMAARVGG